MELAVEIAEHVRQVRFDEIPQSSVNVAKELILDTLGVAIAGSSAAGAKEAVDLMVEWGGAPQSTVLCYSKKLPDIHAAFANSVMIHARDFDDTHDGAVVHSGVTILPTVMALAEKRGGLTGKEFLTALVLGIDLNCRLGLAIGHAPRFHERETRWIRSAVCGIFGAVASACRVEGMTVEKTIHALGIALSQVGGTRQVVGDSALTKRMQPGFMTRSAILSTSLAKRGVTGCREVFEGSYGYFKLYWDGAYARHELTDALGKRFEIENVSLKPYPCCRYTHGPIEATLRCLKRNVFPPHSVEEVNVHLVKHPFFDMVNRPFAFRGNPSVDAQFSIPYVVASALLDGYVFLDSFEAHKVRERADHPLLQKVKVWIDKEVKDPGSLGPVTVEIRVKSGKTFSETAEEFKGHPQNAMSEEECRDKFIRCAAYSVRPFSKETIQKIIERTLHLERLKNTNDLMVLL